MAPTDGHHSERDDDSADSSSQKRRCELTERTSDLSNIEFGVFCFSLILISLVFCLIGCSMKVSEGFQVADCRNLPKVNYFMLMEYLYQNDCYNAAEMRNAKALLASREAYVDTAVGYVELRREQELCTVKCRVTPEHKIKEKLYSVTAVVDESDETIKSVQCNDCAAAAGGCKHGICFVVWLIKQSDTPSVTSTVCYWKKPKLANALNDQKFVLAKDIGKRKILSEVSTEINLTLKMFTEECKRRKTTSGMLLAYCSLTEDTLKKYSIFSLMLQFVNAGSEDTFECFNVFTKKYFTEDVINAISTATSAQAESKLWHTLRKGRITGSKIHEAVHCHTEDGSLVRAILGGQKTPETKAMIRGKMLEKLVLEELEKDLDEAIENTGLILISNIIGASPDGVCKDFVVEIKCPVSVNTMKYYVRNNKVTEKFKAQIMLEMHAAHKLKGLFCIADPTFETSKIIHKYWVDYDKDYAECLIHGAVEFYNKYIYQYILESAK